MLEVGYSVNYVTVVSNEVKIKDGKKFILCSCKCGNKKYIRLETLKSKRIRDCGCGRYMIEKHIGEKYGLLTITDCYRKRINGRINIIAKCICECGNTKDVIISEFRKNKNLVFSCGCFYSFRKEHYIGKIYNGIKIIDFTNINKKNVKCLCKCGNVFECNLFDLTSPQRHIIGCEKCKEYNSKKSKYIWSSKIKNNRIRSIYNKMKDRCYNENAPDYKWYGANNITICDDWLKNYNSFEKWALENGYQEDLTIDRIDNDKGYNPDNCRWADFIVQANNRKNNKKYFYKDKQLTLSEIARIENLNESTLRTRIRSGLSLEEAISNPIKKRS